MPELKKYWAEIRTLEQGLDEYVWLVSAHNPSRGHVGGSIAQASRPLAAKLLHAGSHRAAKDEEVEKHLAGQEAARKKAFTDRLHHHGIALVPVEKTPRTS